MAEEKQLLFGGGALPPKIAEFRKPKPGERPLWYEIYEKAFDELRSSEEGKRNYGDPQKGATLEQVWRTSGVLTGKTPVCLLSTDRPSVETGEIDRVIKMNSNELVDTLIEMSGMEEINATTMLYHDGHMGHCIYLRGYDSQSSRFSYHDPWPGDSLLCRDFNAAGIDAQKKDKYWTITSAELDKVIVAALVYRPLWSEYTGEKYCMTYDELTASDFWGFFHLKEVDRRTLDDTQNTLVRMKTGGFQSEIDLNVTVNQKDRVIEGVLNLKRNWIVGPPHGLNPMAIDILKSFIAALVPPPDKEQASTLVNMLRQITNPAYADQLVSEGPERSFVHRALFTLLGPLPSFDAPFAYSSIVMSNVTRNNDAWLQTQITIDAL
jgi:hypothetical protein